MLDIWSVTSTALTALSIPMAADRYLTAQGADLPDAYLVYQLIDAPPMQHADNDEKLRNYKMQVNYFNRAGLASMPDIEGVMVAAGFTYAAGRNLPFNPETQHFGYSRDFNFLNEE
jgi:hypothetical protein